jgi:acetyl esterase/lipase
LTYGIAAGVPLLYDLYWPRSAPSGSVPLIVYMHAGVGGDKSDVRGEWRTLNALATTGFAVAAINVRNAGVGTIPHLTPTAFPFPDQIEDLKLAVRYFRANAATIGTGIDPDHIGGWGASMGAWLTALNGTTDATDDAALGWTVNGYPDVSSRYQAVVSYFGNEDLILTLAQTQTRADILNAYSALFRNYNAALLTQDSATTYVKADTPPFLEAHGLCDTLAPYQNATEISGLLSQAGVPNDLIPVQNAGHGFVQVGPNPISPSQDQIAADTVEFFETYLRPTNPTPTATIA